MSINHRSIINKEYISALLHISSSVDVIKDLWYNGFIIGTVRGGRQMAVRMNSFAKMHCSINGSEDAFLVDGIIELHQTLQGFDFSTLNKGLR